jgi:hypothetical protein
MSLQKRQVFLLTKRKPEIKNIKRTSPRKRSAMFKFKRKHTFPYFFYNSKLSFKQNPSNENMEEKISENKDKFSPEMPNSMPIVIKSD